MPNPIEDRPPTARLPCPHLPPAEAMMSHRCLTVLRHADRSLFYETALKYGQYLWLNGHSGRAILAITRALYADVPEESPVLMEWPRPYAAIQWMVTHHESNHFPGNPAVSFQHQATRLRGEHRERRSARAWATWALILQARPGLVDDPRATGSHPTIPEIERCLKIHGDNGEARLWRQVLT